MLTSDCPERAILQSKIDSALAVYRKKINRLEALDVPVNFDTLFEPTTRKAGITIEDGFNAEIERLESLGKINSATKHKYALQVLDGYKSVKTALEAIDLDYLKGLELYLRQRGNKDNSIATRFAIFKAIYNKAVKEGKVTVKQNPFTLFQVGSLWAKTRKRAIDKDDIQRLIDLEIADGHTTEYRRLARDLFLFSTFTGLAYSDVKNLTEDNLQTFFDGNLWIITRRKKTNTESNIRLLDVPRKIIEKYRGMTRDNKVFPMPSNTTCNKKLKAIAKLCGIKVHLTYHVARHSAATTVLLSNGVPIETVSRLLGHTNIKTTQIYAKITAQKISQDMETLSHKLEDMEKNICNAIQ